MNFEEEIKVTKTGSVKLGIKPGLTQDEFNSAIIKVLEGIDEAAGRVDQTLGQSAADIVTTAGKGVAKSLYFTPSAADIKVEPNDSFVNVTYDLTEVMKSLPKDAQVKRTTVYVQGNRQVISKSDKTVLTVPVPPNEFPVNVDVVIMGGSPSGDFVIKGNKSLTASKSSDLMLFDTNVTEAKAIVTQEDLNTELLARIISIERTYNSK